MSKDSSTNYYQKVRKDYNKKSRERYQSLS